MLLLFRIRSQPGVVYKGVVNKACNVVLLSFEFEELTFFPVSFWGDI